MRDNFSASVGGQDLPLTSINRASASGSRGSGSTGATFSSGALPSAVSGETEVDGGGPEGRTRRVQTERVVEAAGPWMVPGRTTSTEEEPVGGEGFKVESGTPRK